MRSLGLSVVLLMLGCGGDAGPDTAPDADGSDGGVDAGDAATVASPAAPVFTPCPPAWREVERGGTLECDPWPEGGMQDCGPTEAHFPGAPGCQRIGPPCPTDGVPVGLPTDAPVVYVRQGAVGGDGTLAMPFGVLADAIIAAPTAATVAISPGTYDARQTLIEPVSLVGACTDVVLSNPTGTTSMTVSTEATLRSLRFSNAGDTLYLEGAVHVVDVIIDGAEEALRAFRGTVEVDNLAVRDARAGGVVSSVGATLDLRRAALGRVTGNTLLASASTLRASDVAVYSGETIGATSATFSLEGGDLQLERAAFVDMRGELAETVDATQRWTDVVFEGAAPGITTAEQAIVGATATTVELSRVRLERQRVGGLAAIDGAHLSIDDVIVRDVLTGSDIAGGHGIEVLGGSSLEAARLRVERAIGHGLLLDGSAATVQDLVVTDTGADARGLFGRALQAQAAATLRVERAAIARSHEAAVVAASEGTVVALVDVDVRDTLQRPCAPSCPGAGIGVGSYLQASLDLSRFRSTGHPLAAAQLARDGELDLHDGTIGSSAVGVNVQVLGYDYARLTDGVLFVDNGVNLDATELPIPDATLP